MHVANKNVRMETGGIIDKLRFFTISGKHAYFIHRDERKGLCAIEFSTRLRVSFSARRSRTTWERQNRPIKNAINAPINFFPHHMHT